MGVKFGLSH